MPAGARNCEAPGPAYAPQSGWWFRSRDPRRKHVPPFSGVKSVMQVLNWRPNGISLGNVPRFSSFA